MPLSDSDHPIRKRYIVLYSCMIVCSVLAGLTGIIAANHSKDIADHQNARLAKQSVRLTQQNNKIVQQEKLDCLANTQVLLLLKGIRTRSVNRVKIDSPSQAKIDRQSIIQVTHLIEGYEPTTKFCAKHKKGEK